MGEKENFKNIKVPSDIQKRLDKYKSHPRQPYWEVIKKLIEENE